MQALVILLYVTGVLLSYVLYRNIKLSLTFLQEYFTMGKSLAIYFGDSQFRRNRAFNYIVSKKFVDKRSLVR